MCPRQSTLCTTRFAPLLYQICILSYHKSRPITIQFCVVITLELADSMKFRTHLPAIADYIFSISEFNEWTGAIAFENGISKAISTMSSRVGQQVYYDTECTNEGSLHWAWHPLPISRSFASVNIRLKRLLNPLRMTLFFLAVFKCDSPE